MHQLSALKFLATENPEKSPKRQLPIITAPHDLQLSSDDQDTGSLGHVVTAAEMGACLALVCASLCVASVVVVVGVEQLEQLHHLNATTALLRESLFPLPPAIQNAPLPLKDSRDVRREGNNELRTDRAARQKRSRQSRRSRHNHDMTGYHFALSDGKGEGRLPLLSNLTSEHSYHRCWFKWVGPLTHDDVTAVPSRSGSACEVLIHTPGVYLVYGQMISQPLLTSESSVLLMTVLRNGADSWETLLKYTPEQHRISEVPGITDDTVSYLSRLVTLDAGDRVVLGQNGTVTKISLHPRDSFLGFVKLS